MSGLRQWVKARVPAIARRDAQLDQQRKLIAQLKRELDKVTASRDEARKHAERRSAALEAAQATELRPSFQREIRDLLRRPEFAHVVDPERWLPSRQIPFKLRNYRLAASHGVAVPTVYGSWSTLKEVDLETLPDTFVLKSDGGAGAAGVFPLKRLAPHRYEWLANGTFLNGTEIIELMRSRGGRARPPYFAEELLYGESPDLLPDDVKIYAFYGQIGHILLRRVVAHDGRSQVFSRYIDSTGKTLDVQAVDRRIDPNIPTPAELPRMVDIARHLSRAVGLPFCRVDLYGVDHGVLLGEITRAPGGLQQYAAEHDEYLGRLFADARERLELDTVRGRPPGVLHGDLEVANPYPAKHKSRRDDPGSWGLRSAPCHQWCTPPRR